MFDYEKYILHIPEPVLLRMLRFLRYPDLINLKTACPELEDYCNLHIRLLDQEFPRRPFFQFERCAPERDIEEDDNIEIMSERQNVSMVYYPGNRSVYLFGGEVLDTNDDLPAATFNDMWRLDTATMKWSRLDRKSLNQVMTKSSF
uniref:F-box domain-containing protein n=1 Tax=Caenorhabditis tropicalis TaxID=1561998 RepID=A0A1I7UK20_9PELO